MKWLGITGLLIAGIVAIYVVAYPSLTLRYRLTLEAQVDGEPKVGSGVIEVTYSKQVKIRSDLSIGYRGEAVVLDLGDRGTLFALLRAGNDSRSIPESIILLVYGFDGGAFPWSSVEEGQAQLRRLAGKRELPLASLPMLVRFRDPNDLMSVETVSPLNIEERFGARAELVRATLEIVPAGIWPFNRYGITGEPVTAGIESKLPWWNGPFPWQKPMGNGVYIDTRTDPFKINKEDFKRG
jgi:hypothetical protein